MTQYDKQQLRRARAELVLLLARYDSGAMSPAVWSSVKQIQTEISWLEHQRNDQEARP